MSRCIPEHAVGSRMLGPKVKLNISHKLLGQLESTSGRGTLQKVSYIVSKDN